MCIYYAYIYILYILECSFSWETSQQPEEWLVTPVSTWIAGANADRGYDAKSCAHPSDWKGIFFRKAPYFSWICPRISGHGTTKYIRVSSPIYLIFQQFVFCKCG